MKEENGEKFRVLFENSPEALMYTDDNYRVIAINSRFKDLFGYSIEEIKGKNINDFIVPEEKKKEAEDLDYMSQKGYVFYETVRKRKDGTLIHVSISANPIISDGKIKGRMVMYKDITERKEIERKLSAIYDFSRDISLTYDINKLANVTLKAAEKIFGFNIFHFMLIDDEKNELVVIAHIGELKKTKFPLEGKGVTVYVAKTGIPLNIKDVSKDDRYIEGVPGVKSEMCVPLKVKDQIIGVLNVESKKLNAFNEKDLELLEVLASQTAIAIKNAELFTELSSLKEFNEKIVNSLNEGIWMEDEKGFCTYANPKMKEMLGYDTLIGKHWRDVIAPEEIDHVAKETKTRRQKRKSSYETLLLAKNGERIPIIVSATPLFEKGKYIGMIGVIVDIREQKKIEGSLKESRELYRSLSEFNKTLLEHSSVGIMNINKDMIVEYTNPEMRRILGLPFGKELDATWRDIRKVPFFEETGISSLFEELKKGKEISKDVSFTFPGGEKGYVTLKGVPILKDSKFAGAVLIVNDITERKKMEEALQKEKDKVQKYLDIARVMIIVVGADQKITLINKKGCEILEGSEKEIVGKNWFDNFVPEKNRKKAKEGFEKLMRGEVKLIEYGEFSVLTKSGKEKIIAWRNTLLKDEQGNIIGVLSSGSDITEKKKIEKKLRESEKRFRDVALSSADWIWEVDKNGRYTFASGKVKQILGYDPEEIIGKTPLELMPKEEAERIGKIFEKIVSEKKPIVDLENWNLTKEGEKVCLLTNGVPIIDEKGDLLGYRGVDKDITKRKKMEAELRKSEKKYRTTFEHTGTAMAILEEDATISLVNTKFEEISGYSKEEIEGKMKWTEFVHPEDLKKMMKYHRKRRENPEEVPKEYEFRVIDRNGNIRYMLLNVDLIPETKQSIVSLIDINDRKKFEEKIKRLHEVAAKMESIESEEEIYKTAIEVAEKILKFDMCVIMIREGGCLVVKASSGCVPPTGKRSMLITEGIAGKTYREKKSHLTRDMQKEKDAKPAMSNYRSGISVPIGDLGVFQAASEKTDAFSKEDLELVELLIAHVSEALKRIKFEKTLKESEEKYRTSIESAPYGIAMVDPDGNVLIANSQLEKITGYTRKEIPDLETWFEKMYPDEEYRRSVIEENKRIIPGEDPRIREAVITRKDGKKRVCRFISKILPSDTRIVFVTDITEQKKAEEKLKKSEQKLRSFFESATVGIWCFRLRKPVDITVSEEKILNEIFKARCVECNETYAKMMGATKNEILGMQLSEVMPNTEENREYLKAFIRNGFRMSGGISHEINKKGEEKYFSNSMVGTIKNGKVIEAWGTQTDITELKHLQQQKERAMKEIEFYSDILAHDIGNINQATFGYLYMLENTEDEEKRKKYLRSIRKAIEKTRRLSESIKILKEIESIEVKKVDLNRTIEKAIEEIKDYYDGEIKVNFVERKRYYVRANEFLDRVFFNILENSVEYTLNEPVIIDIKISEKDNLCNISIRDYGLGISKEKKEDILNSLETLSKRTGIGFYFMKKILDRVGGSFEIKDVDPGTEILVTLPMCNEGGKE